MLFMLKKPPVSQRLGAPRPEFGEAQRLAGLRSRVTLAEVGVRPHVSARAKDWDGFERVLREAAETPVVEIDATYIDGRFVGTRRL